MANRHFTTNEKVREDRQQRINEQRRVRAERQRTVRERQALERLARTFNERAGRQHKTEVR